MSSPWDATLNFYIHQSEKKKTFELVHIEMKNGHIVSHWQVHDHVLPLE